MAKRNSHTALRLDELTDEQLNQVQFRSLDWNRATIKSEKLADGTFKFSGMASTTDIDEGNDVVEAKAFESSLQQYLSWGTLLFNHDFYSLAIGKITHAEIRENGLYVEGVIADTQTGADVIKLIAIKAIKAMSIAFFMKRHTENEDGTRIIHDLELLEISMVNRPMNPNALLELSKQYKSRSTQHSTRGDKTMPDLNMKQLESSLEQMGTSITEHDKRVEELKGKQDSVFEKVNALRSEIKAMQDLGILGETDVEAKIQRMTDALKADVLDMKTKVDAMSASNKHHDNLHPFSELKNWLSNPDVDPISKYHGVLRAPVELVGESDAQKVRKFRQLNDYVTMMNSFMSQPKASINPQKFRNSPAVKMYMNLAEQIDGEMAKAISTSVAGSGSEWHPDVWGNELIDIYRLESGVAKIFPSFQMVNSSVKWPLLTGSPVFYAGTQAVTGNPDQVPKTSPNSSDATFTAKKVWAAVPISREAVADLTLFPIMDDIRRQLSLAHADSVDSMIINGDTAATHQDNATNTLWASSAPELLWDGLRKNARTNAKTFDVQSAVAGIGDATTAFVAKDARHCRKLLGKAGVRIRQLAYIVSPGGYFEMLDFSQVADASQWGQASTYLTGVLEALDGVGIHISAEHRDDLGAAGVYTNGATSFSSIICANSGGARIAELEMFLMETDYDPMTQQFNLIASSRMDFQPVWKTATTGDQWVSEGFNVIV